jgi:hypothetical protein
MFAEGVDAGVGQQKSLYRLASQDVGLDDLVHVSELHSPVPHAIGINHEVGAMFTLVEAAGLVGAYAVLKSTLSQLLLEGPLQFTLSVAIAGAARVAIGALVDANKNVFFEFRHAVKCSGK